MQRAEAEADIVDDVRRLTHPWRHVETVGKVTHTSLHPSLITQVRIEAVAATSAQENGPGIATSSRPPLPTDVLGVLTEVTRVSTEVALFMPNMRLRLTPEDNLRYVAGHMHALDNAIIEQAAARIGWLTRECERVLRWSHESHRLDARCPHCHAYGSIIVHMDDYGPTEAKCTRCSREWDHATLGILARELTDDDTVAG